MMDLLHNIPCLTHGSEASGVLRPRFTSGHVRLVSTPSQDFMLKSASISGDRPITLDAVSPTTVLGEDADIGHTPAGGLTLSQNEKRRRDGYQLSVFYTISFRTTSGRGARTACIDPL